MDPRKRCFLSAPERKAEYTIKKEISEKRSFPPCPPLSAKFNKRMAQKSLFQERSVARAVFFQKPVDLSRLYNADKDQTYFEQLYSKNDKIGEGSFGIVYKVTSRDDDKLYAVKQMKASHSLNYGYAEVKNYEKIGHHDNCVKYIMAWEELKIIHIVMEYCSLSLAQYSCISAKITESQLWEILYDMLNALDYLHSKNLIHLDIKPGNILMSKGFYKLADFGLLVDLNKHDGRKISTVSDGDAKYLASEVLNGIYTYSCDVFGLGISLLELATNIELPEFGPLWHEIRQRNLPEEFYDGFTKQFTTTIKKMMTSVYWQRPPASKLLKSPALKKVQKQDQKSPRNNYCQGICDDAEVVNTDNILEDNIVETPRRPLYEVRNALNNEDSDIQDLQMDSPKNLNDSCTELDANSTEISTNRCGLSRVRLKF